MFKFVIFTVLFSLSCALLQQPRALCNSDNDHNLIDGCVNFDPATDRKLLHKEIAVPWKLLTVNKKTITFPETGPGTEKITCIRVTDLMANGRGGCPLIINGGSELNEATIIFISQRGRDMKFILEIYGS